MHHAVILAGGGGTRLWPASRQDRPKQLLPLGKRPGEALITATVRRMHPLVATERTWVVTAARHAAEVASATGLDAARVIGEPCPRNTAAALGLAAVNVAHTDPDAVIAALPSDHAVADEDEFRVVCERALELAETQDCIVTVGIRPTRPDTGFGYLQVKSGLSDVLEVARFIEKPDAARADELARSGETLWNAGMFFFRASRLLADIETHLPDLAAGLGRIAEALGAEEQDAYAHAVEAVYPALSRVSIDTGVMEKTQGIVALPGDFGWSDVGTWAALAELRPPDLAGNILQGTTYVHDASGNILVSDDDTAIAALGVTDLVVIKSGNAILVAPRSRVQDVRDLVDHIRAHEGTDYL